MNVRVRNFKPLYIQKIICDFFLIFYYSSFYVFAMILGFLIEASLREKNILELRTLHF